MERRGRSERRLGAFLGIAGLGLFASVIATEAYVWLNLWPVRVRWSEAVVWSLPLLAAWLALLPVVARLARRWPVAPNRPAVVLAGHVVGSVVFSLAGLALVHVSDNLVHWSRALAAPSKLVADMRYTILHIHLGIAAYWVTVGGLHALDYYHRSREGDRRAHQLEAELAGAQLAALRAQLEPHFLFNTLNSITVLVRRDPAEAEETLRRFSRLLRLVLDRHAEPEVPLGREVAFAREYLEIQRVRFPDRLRVAVAVPAELQAALVPTLILQPLVENAVHHGIASRAAGGLVEIEAARRGSALTLMVRDDGPGPPNGRALEEGIGLANTRARLRALYGAAADLTLRKRERGGLEATVVLPWRGGPGAGAESA